VITQGFERQTRESNFHRVETQNSLTGYEKSEP